MLKSFNCLLVISTITFLFYCKGKDGTPGPQGAPGTDGKSNVTTGTSSGFAHLLTEFGYPAFKNHAGIKVTLLGSVPEITVETDTTGKFTFSNVKTGNYDLLLKKDGFPDYQYNTFVIFEGPKPLYNYTNILMAQKSTTVLTNLTAKLDSNFGIKTVKFKVKVSPESTQEKGRSVLFVISNKPEVSINDLKDYENTYGNLTKTYSISTIAMGDSAVISLTYGSNSYPFYNFYNGIDFSKGSQICCKAYGIPRTNDGYYYSSSNIRIFPSVSPNSSNTASVFIK